MNPQFPIYIVSKGRADTRFTSKALERMRVPYFIVVEEQEFDQYAAVIDPAKILVLDKTFQRDYDTCDSLRDTKSKGPGAARNFAWAHALKSGAEYHWVMDDNIRHFIRWNHNRQIPAGDGTVIRCMEDFVLRYTNVVMAGPNYDMFVPRKNLAPPFVANTRIYSCNLIRNSIPYRWRGRYNEDTDLSLRILKDGWCTIQFNAFLQYKAPTQTVKGGNSADFYEKEGTLPKSKMQVNLHPDVSKIVFRFGRWHHHVNYAPFKKNKLIRRTDIQITNEPNEYGLQVRSRFPIATKRAEPLPSWSGATKYIPSAGRADLATTPALLQESGIDFRIMVEPRDQEAYTNRFGRDAIVVLSDNKRGCAFARRGCQTHSESLHEPYHWQLDDNIKAFCTRINGKTVRCPASEVLGGIEAEVSQYSNIGMAGPRYATWAFRFDEPIQVNRQVSSAMLIRNGTGSYFVSGTNCDTDLNLQLLTRGLVSMLFNHLTIVKQPYSGMRGGCTDADYVNNGRAARCQALIKAWPQFPFRVRSKDPTRIAPCQIWSKFTQRPQPHGTDAGTDRADRTHQHAQLVEGSAR